MPCKWQCAKRLCLDKLDQQFAATGQGDQEEIDSRSIRSGARGGINRREAEAHAKNFRCAIDVVDVHFNLLDSFAKFVQVTRNRARSAGLAAGQYVQAHAIRKLQLEFLRVLVGRHIGQRRRPIRRVDGVESLRSDGNPDSDLRRAGNIDARGHLGISHPFAEQRRNEPRARAEDRLRRAAPDGAGGVA